MKVLSLRFGEKFAPECGTIAAHAEILDRNGHVWYGKFGNSVSERISKALMKEPDPRLLLIKSGTVDRYWAHIDKLQRNTPELNLIPSYYRDKINLIKYWFRINKIEDAPKDIMSHCTIISSGAKLSDVSRITMNPCLFVECNIKNIGEEDAE